MVISINKTIKKPSPDVFVSMERLNRALYTTPLTPLDLTANIEYWKEHGVLPKTTDFSAIHRENNNRRAGV